MDGAYTRIGMDGNGGQAWAVWQFPVSAFIRRNDLLSRISDHDRLSLGKGVMRITYGGDSGHGVVGLEGGMEKLGI